MKIAHFNYGLNGGAGIASRRLHDSLVSYDIDSKFYHLESISPSNSYINLQENTKNNIYNKLHKKIKHRLYHKGLNRHIIGRPEGYELFSYSQLVQKTNILSMIGNYPSLVHLHWISNLIDYPSFFSSIPDSLPIVWTLHDMNPFTGGCHYAWDCHQYKEHCNNCPQVAIPSDFDISYKNFSIKKKSLINKNLHIVADSHWLEKEARSSKIFENAKSFHTIHYGLDHKLFYPIKKVVCKASLGIDPSTTVIAFGADNITNRRKGLKELIDALKQIEPTNNILLLCFGKGKSQIDINNIKIKHVGFMESPSLLSLIYSASDMFVIPSLYEAFGQTSLEAMACGTPVIGFDTGGIPDMVHHGKTGLLAKPKDSHDLAMQIKWLVNHPKERKQMGINARQLVEQEYTLQVQAEKYIFLYIKLLSKHID